MPRPTPFLATTPRVRVLILFIILSDFDDEITTLPVRPAPSPSDRLPDLSGYPLDSGNNLLNGDLSETAESLPARTASTLVVHLLTTLSLPISLAFARRPGKEIPNDIQ
nr:hypothetical protein [Tanacetum cinerariifolium]